jgi:hypothetical protein
MTQNPMKAEVQSIDSEEKAKRATIEGYQQRLRENNLKA